VNERKKKRAGGVPQAAECLPSKCEALSSSPRTSETNKTKTVFQETKKYIHKEQRNE
jgi:hypothetical protein